MRVVTLFVVALSLVLGASAQGQKNTNPHPFLDGVNLTDYDAQLERDVPWLLATYKMLHAAPELSHHEEKTAAFFATELRKFGFTVTERIGKFEHPEWNGYGVVGWILKGSRPEKVTRRPSATKRAAEASNGYGHVHVSGGVACGGAAGY